MVVDQEEAVRRRANRSRYGASHYETVQIRRKPAHPRRCAADRGHLERLGRLGDENAQLPDTSISQQKKAKEREDMPEQGDSASGETEEEDDEERESTLGAETKRQPRPTDEHPVQ